jgi:hypothetical protein
MQFIKTCVSFNICYDNKTNENVEQLYFLACEVITTLIEK